jgi:glycosyltransferase involved in cell wall biosynthesis
VSANGPRRVLMLAATLAGDGLERQLTLLATHLPPTWRPTVWSADGGPFAEVLLASGVDLRLRPRRSRRDPLPFADLACLIASRRPDVVHAWHWLPNVVAAPVTRALGIPLLDGTIRQGRPSGGREGLRRRLLASADIVVANSRAGLAGWGVPPSRGRVVYNAFDPVRLDAVSAMLAARGSRGRVEGPLTVVMTGRMHPHKDHATLLAAARLVRGRSGPGRWRFVLVGDGELRPSLQARAADLIADGTVEFISPGLEVLPHVAEADIGVLTTNDAVHAEGCSNSIMEYMACGLPVVCCDNGGNRELVADGETGYVVRSGDAEALAFGLNRLREDPAGRVAMGELGRERLLSGFSVARMTESYVRIYEECAARPSRAGRRCRR